MTVAIVTGSQTCIPREMAERYRIEVLPYTLELDDRLYRDGVDITPEEFYNLLPNLDGMAHTSAIPPGTYLDTFRELSSRADGILVITIAGGMSTIYQNACLAATSFKEIPVRVIDSGTAAMAQGFVAIEAARSGLDGASLDECYRVAETASGKAELFAYINTFEYLKRSGRVNAAKAFAASALSIKPVFNFKAGEPVLVAKKRSTMKAREYIADRVERYYLQRGPLQLSVFHAAALGEAGELAKMILDRVDVSGEVFLTEFTPVMGCHTGPGVVGAAFI